MDLDLSEDNLPVGQRLKIGETTVEVTEIPHTGCKKFVARYGTEALDFINAEERASLRLRGVYVMVIEEGVIKAGGHDREDLTATSRAIEKEAPVVCGTSGAYCFPQKRLSEGRGF